MMAEYKRDIVHKLVSRLNEPRRFIQVVSGPRQTGKTTAISQALSEMSNLPCHSVQVGADSATRDWLRREWGEARRLAAKSKSVLVVDEIQLVDQWSSVVKELWDEDTKTGTDLLVVLSGSSSLLLQKGLIEGLTGRFEELKCYQWDFDECMQAFGFSLEDYLYFGGYPGAAPLVSDESRWLDYMTSSIIAPSIFKDVISLGKVTKPVLMEALFTLGTAYSGQEVSYRKLMGQLDDAGNATTVAHYLQLLREAGLLAGIQKHSKKLIKTRASSPRLIAFDTSLMVANYGRYREFLLTDPERRGHLVECAVGAYLLRRGLREHFDVEWWRDGSNEVDFILSSGRAVTVIEVKSGRIKSLKGLDAFCRDVPEAKSLVVGSADAPLDEFLLGHIPLF